MKLILVGVNAPHSTSVSLAKALRLEGHEVLEFDYRAAGTHKGLTGMLKDLDAACQGYDAAVFMKAFGPPPIVVHPGLMRALGDRMKTVYWFADPLRIQWPGCLDLARACQIVSATGLESCVGFTAAGCQNVNQIFEGFDPDTFHFEKRPKLRDLVFVGSEDARRAEYLMHLRLRCRPVDRPAAYGDDLRRVYAESKIVLNFSRGDLFSDRVIQAMACGTFLLTEGCNDLEAAFGDSPCMGSFANKQELHRAVEFWLTNESDREARAALGCEAVQRYAWREQAKKLVRVIQGERVFDGAFRLESLTPPKYEPEAYWKGRLGKFGMDLRGVGRIDLTHAENERVYAQAWDVLASVLQDEKVLGPDVRVLDVGCGTGYFAKKLAEAGIEKYVGLDVTDVLHDTIRASLPADFLLRKLDIGKDSLPPADGTALFHTFDLALMIDVTQHIVSDESFAHAMQEVGTHLEPGGLLLVTSWLDAGARQSFYERSRNLADYEKAFPGWQFSAPMRFRDKWLLAIRKPKEGAA